jgi:sec-independent protein translocase protein TatC
VGKPKPSAAQQPIDDRPEDDVEMTFFEHIGELRTRLVRALLSTIPGVAVGWYYREELLAWLVQPYVRANVRLGLGQQLHFADPSDAFFWYLVIAAVAGLLFASPVVFWQIWGFIAPGLYRRERRLALPFVMASTVFFLGGVFFCYATVLDPAFQLMLGFGGEVANSGLRLVPMIMIDHYLSFATRFLLAFGVTFEVPVVVSFLSFAGLVNWRQLVAFARWWLLISSIIAAVLTPPDAGSMIAMLVPLNVLYWLGVGVAFLFGPKAPKLGANATTEEGFER